MTPPAQRPAPEPPSEPVAERLARWLTGLDLVGHLEETGVLRLVRGHDGRAHWSDPATGEPVLSARLEEIESALRDQGEDPAHGVPVGLLAATRLARLRHELLDSPWFTYETLAEVRGATIEATRFAVTRAAQERRLLTVPTELAMLVPAFQLTDAGEPRPELAPVLDALLAGRRDPWRAWVWLTQPAALLAGDVPERVAADPDRAAEVAWAARRLAERR